MFVKAISRRKQNRHVTFIPFSFISTHSCLIWLHNCDYIQSVFIIFDNFNFKQQII